MVALSCSRWGFGLAPQFIAEWKHKLKTAFDLGAHWNALKRIEYCWFECGDIMRCHSASEYFMGSHNLGSAAVLQHWHAWDPHPWSMTAVTEWWDRNCHNPASITLEDSLKIFKPMRFQVCTCDSLRLRLCFCWLGANLSWTGIGPTGIQCKIFISFPGPRFYMQQKMPWIHVVSFMKVICWSFSLKSVSWLAIVIHSILMYII